MRRADRAESVHPGCTLPRWQAKLALAVVKLLPRWVVYWCVIRALNYATTGPYNCWSNEEVTAVTAMTVLQRWPR